MRKLHLVYHWNLLDRIPKIYAAALATLVAMQASPLGAQLDQRPNVVVIMADDIGPGDLSFYHRQRTHTPPAVTTPILDRLINEGMRFSDAHSPASLCAPTRFSMMTGNYSYRNSQPWGVWSPEGDALIEPQFTTVARIAKAGGYHTSFFGKWGLGGLWTKEKPDYTMIDAGANYYGFDYAVVLPQGIQNFPYAFYENHHWMKLKPSSRLVHIPFEQTGYTKREPDRDRSGTGDSNWNPRLAGPTLAAKAVAYIEKQAKTHPGDPFYMYYCSQAVHVPHRPPVRLDGIKIAGTTPGTHGDMVRELDAQVGMIIKALKKAGIYQNTLLIFTSDNGGLNDREMAEAGHDSTNGLRGHKGSIFEGGHRVPFIAVWPDKIRPNSVCEVPIVAHDMVATIATLAGQTLDRHQVRDSTCLLPYFKENTKAPAHKYLMHRSRAGPVFALRAGNWKLILQAVLGSVNKGDYQELIDGELGHVVPIALFNLKENPNEDEAQNLVKDPQQGGRVKTMFATYKRLRESEVGTGIN